LVGLNALQREDVLQLLMRTKRKQVVTDAVPGIGIVGEVFCENVRQNSIKIQSLTRILGPRTLALNQGLADSARKRRNRVLACLVARHATIAAMKVQDQSLIVDVSRPQLLRPRLVQSDPRENAFQRGHRGGELEQQCELKHAGPVEYTNAA